MKYCITTRSRSEDLYALSSSFFPDSVCRHRFVNYDHWSDALRYLKDIQNLDYDFIINIDEDCFVYDWERLESFIKPGITLSGMPDSLDFCSHRNNAKFVHNPFFNIFIPSRVRKVLLNSVGFIKYASTGFVVPGCAFHEPFNCFFYGLRKEPRIDIPCENMKDGISTNIGGFALHSWYSREFEGSHRDRILNIYNDANNMRSI